MPPEVTGCEQCIRQGAFIIENSLSHFLPTLSHTHRGHGVRAMQSIRRDAFIIEYSGEVLDSAELDFRMGEARRTGEQHFYIMELDPGEERGEGGGRDRGE